MPRGAMYDDGIPHSDNAIDPGVSKVHDANPGSDVDRSWKAAPLPAEMGTVGLHSGQGSRGYPYPGKGKGGHNPRTLGERKGLGARNYGLQ
ncbi:hypothetical protein VTN77DRAFT_7640 [Rasamsonia byssochlamydoides]|uniref:uncharacterized protein n=1 Tax=Rasamsonia byssochlamydoides TaxID=89139 RepID=UPI0037428830